MSGYPILLDGGRIDALVVGGGSVAHRKATALLECGAQVRVVAPEICEALEAAAARTPRLVLTRRPYAPDDVAGATLVFAATDDRAVNARVRADAMRSHRLVNVATAPDQSGFVTAAVHREDPLVIAVSTGRVPRAAARIRDAVASRFDARFRSAIVALAALRERLLATGDGSRWAAAEADLLDEQFCTHVEDGSFASRCARWDGTPVDGVATWG